MSINTYIDKIIKENSQYIKSCMPVVLPRIKYDLVLFNDDILYWDNGILIGGGYYVLVDGEPIFTTYQDSPMYTSKFYINTDIETTCTYTGSLTRDCIFIIEIDGEDDKYISINKTNDIIEEVKIYIPANTISITCTTSIVDGSNNFALKVSMEKYIDITRYSSNWENVEFAIERDGLSGSYLDLTTPIEIIGQAGSLMRYMFNDKDLYCRASINIYKRKIYNNIYDFIRRIDLDFQTYIDKDNKISISGTKDTLQEFIKSGRNTKFDIPVDEIADKKKWRYNRIDLLSSSNYTALQQDTYGAASDPNPPYAPPSVSLISLSMDKYETSSDAIQHDSQGQSAFFREHQQYFDDNDYLFKAKGNVDIQINMSFTVYTNKTEGLIIRLSKNLKSNLPNGIVIKSWDFNNEVVIDESINISLVENDTLTLWIYSPFTESWQYFVVKDFKKFTIRWKTQSSPIDMKVINPQSLLQSLLDRISNGSGRFKGEIQWDESFKPMLIVGETIRNFPEATYHGSLKDFIDWMDIMGYTYSFINNKMIYKKRDEYYNVDEIAIELSESEISDMSISADGESAYTSIEIGYKRQDYDQSNGYLEPNFTFSYMTNYTNQGENILSLISPYRADSLGIELLCWKRNEFTTDDKSDTNVFIVELIEDEDIYILNNENEIISDNVKLFNGSLNPYFLVKRNESKIGIISKKIRFTGTDGFRKSTINGQDILYNDISISKQMFKPKLYTFNVGTNKDLPTQNISDGIVNIIYKDSIKRGFIKTIKKNYGKNKPIEWVLYGID